MKALWKPKYDLALKGEKISFDFSAEIQGMQFFFTVYLNPIFSDGKITGVSALSVDISERIRADKALLESEKKFRQFVETAFEGIMAADKDNKITFLNNRMSEMIGYTMEEIIGQKFSHFMFSEDLNDYQERMMKRQQGIGEVFERRFRHKNGSVFWALVSASPMYTNNGEYNGSLGMVTDISDRKKVEEALIKAKEKAEESDRLKSAFLANMSHEIRTPMNGILGFAELLKNPFLTGEQQQEYIMIIENSGIRMINILNDLIDLSKIESGHVDVVITPCDINKQTEDVYSFFKPEVDLKGIQFSLNNSLIGTESFIQTDIDKVNAILINLVKNSLKFTRKGLIEFGYKKKGSFLEFYVKDTGVGIPAEQQSIIFERFRQGSESLSRNYEGAGLGLSIARSYVNLLGGEIRVESLPDSDQKYTGSTFYFTIPFIPFNEAKQASADGVSPAGKNNNGLSLKILIAEDDKTSELLFTRILKDYSKEIIKVNNGIDAIEACKNNPDLDLILMDIKMPEMNGYEATARIRQFNKDVVIIAQTAFAMPGDKEKALEAGCDDYITKPLNQAGLKDLILKNFKN